MDPTQDSVYGPAFDRVEKRSKTALVVAAVAVLLAVVALIVAFVALADDDGDPDGDDVDAMSEVSSVACVNESGTWAAAGTVSNGTEKESNYVLRVEFVEAGGNVAATETVGVDDVAAGGTKDWSARSDDPEGDGVQCKVTDAVRHLSL